MPSLDLILALVGIWVVVLHVYLAVIATYVATHDPLLETPQRIGQPIFAWVIPILGALIVIRLALEHSPDVISLKWIPWPLRATVRNSPRKSNQLRDEDEGAEWHP